MVAPPSGRVTHDRFPLDETAVCRFATSALATGRALCHATLPPSPGMISNSRGEIQRSPSRAREELNLLTRPNRATPFTIGDTVTNSKPRPSSWIGKRSFFPASSTRPER